ncbi:hypothetical protein [Yoonia sp. 208BN28-4]|uniref:hypothetical protein n=1 Tax=Yoonia sp. 208BN28-4 TaxID=3126505 RepID=UPI0030AF8A15
MTQPLPPAIRLQAEAYCALIDRRLCSTASPIAGSQARALLDQLVTTGEARMGNVGGITSPPQATFTLAGITAAIPSNTPLTVLHTWQAKARRLIAQTKRKPL